jgi:hypothetical protein
MSMGIRLESHWLRKEEVVNSTSEEPLQMFPEEVTRVLGLTRQLGPNLAEVDIQRQFSL